MSLFLRTLFSLRFIVSVFISFVNGCFQEGVGGGDGSGLRRRDERGALRARSVEFLIEVGDVVVGSGGGEVELGGEARGEPRMRS